MHSINKTSVFVRKKNIGGVNNSGRNANAPMTPCTGTTHIEKNYIAEPNYNYFNAI